MVAILNRHSPDWPPAPGFSPGGDDTGETPSARQELRARVRQHRYCVPAVVEGSYQGSLQVMQRIFDLPHATARSLLRSGAPVYLLVNPIEYHGPHLSLHNDSWLSLGLCQRIHKRIEWPGDWPLLLGHDMEIGVAPAPGPGSRFTSFAGVRSLVQCACDALVEMGARSIVLMTFHGAPMHNWALHEVVTTLNNRGIRAIAPFSIVVAKQFDLAPEEYREAVAHLPADTADRLLSKLSLDFHAGFFETSVALALAPQTVSELHRDLPPCPRVPVNEALLRMSRLSERLGKSRMAAEMHHAALAANWGELRPFPGYTSEPAHANAASGEFFVEKILELYRHAMTATLIEGTLPSPPPLSWMRSLTLGGRLSPPVPAEVPTSWPGD